jgi:ketosteroid isomerase-like protein
MNRGAAAVVEEFLRPQPEMYGNDHRPVGALVADDVVWHVPGTSPIAGGYRAARRSRLRGRRMQSPAKPGRRSRRLLMLGTSKPPGCPHR